MRASRKWTAVTVFSVCGLAMSAHAQVANNEVEPNDGKAAATVADSGGLGMVAGDFLQGNTTGTSTTVPGAGSADYFLVKTKAAAAGIYRHRLVVNSAVAGHTASIRGLLQTNGVITTTETAIQTSSATSTPARFIQWYGFGKQEQLYVSITGSATTTADYQAVLEDATVTPTNIGTFVAGPITISTVGQTTVDTDMWVYDSNFNAIPQFGNDDEPAPGTSFQSKLARTFSAGTYYLAVTSYNLANDQAVAPDERTPSADAVVDFPNSVANSSTTTNQNVNFTVTSAAGTAPFTATKAGAFDVVWVTFTVTTPTATGACCKPDGTCSVGTIVDCLNAGGAYAGDNVTCAAANCPPGGACCKEDGTCSFVTSAICTTQGGVYRGDNIACAAANCVPSAYNETGDAGDITTSAAIVSGPAGAALTRIRGTIGAAGDTDMYQIQVCDAANFLAASVGGTTIDTVMAMFKSDGRGVSFNDDEVGGTTLQSKITAQFVAPVGNGVYYLAIAGWNHIPAGATGNIWLNDGVAAPYRSERAPDGPGAADPITGWNTSTSTATGAYTISLTGACFVGAAGGCYANCDNSTAAPVLNSLDFGCFLTKFAAADTYANCDNSSNPPILNALDFGCFLTKFAAGCT